MQVDLYISYSQIAIFIGSLNNSFNDWTEEHVNQGFSWRPGSVSFRTLREQGLHRIDINVVEDMDKYRADALRVIDVPFEILDGDAIEVGSISETITFSIPPGKYQLRCQFMPNTADSTIFPVSLTFSRNNEPKFDILVCDEHLSPPRKLLTNTVPAAGGL